MTGQRITSPKVRELPFDSGSRLEIVFSSVADAPVSRCLPGQVGVGLWEHVPTFGKKNFQVRQWRLAGP
jgi:hypothetical protein